MLQISIHNGQITFNCLCMAFQTYCVSAKNHPTKCGATLHCTPASYTHVIVTTWPLGFWVENYGDCSKIGPHGMNSGTRAPLMYSLNWCGFYKSPPCYQVVAMVL